jgi:PsbP
MSLCFDFQKWTIISLSSLTIGLIIGLIIWTFAFADNVTAQTVEFKILTNNIMNFSILFPSNWQLSENFEDSETLGNRVSFEIPDRNLSRFIINTKKVEPYLDTDTMTLKNTSLQQYVQQLLNKSKTPPPAIFGIRDFTIIRQNAVTVGGYSGWKIEYKLSMHDESFYGFNIHTIANGKIYTLTYEDDPLKVPERLPIIKKMVESFKVIK